MSSERDIRFVANEALDMMERAGFDGEPVYRYFAWCIASNVPPDLEELRAVIWEGAKLDDAT